MSFFTLKVLKKQRKRIRSRGLTLIELLTTMSILLIIMGAVYSMLYAGVIMWQSSVTRTSNRQDIHISFRKFELELRNSDASFITDGTSGEPYAFSFLSAYNQSGNFTTDASGRPVWQKYVIYYIPAGTKKLLRKEVYGSFTAPLSASQLATYLDGEGKLISSSVKSMKIIPNTSNNSAIVSLTVNNDSKHGKRDEQNLNLTVSLRN